ncbi:hypothetical protein L596_012328 [Steinernema carpocapsae]|uniref:Uncharacterized protein n=1 Tax=Steinernema carpocapsae TaxID=34508 RepID=A0A4U5NWZ3_STECR|nr:hypothetical protein L596_012328 [Steinernema carpocapsae]
MNVPQKGYIVYPKKDKHIPFEMRYFLPLIDAFCFPLLNGYGEESHKTGIPYQEEKKPYFQRMVETKSDLLLKELKSIGTKKNTIEKRFRQGRKFKWKRFGENSTKTRLMIKKKGLVPFRGRRR